MVTKMVNSAAYGLASESLREPHFLSMAISSINWDVTQFNIQKNYGNYHLFREQIY
jgi:hypothetical protein